MPLVRYFLFTGGILVGLIFIADWYFPKPQAEAAVADIDRSVIRIRSNRASRAAANIDTNAPMPLATQPQLALGDETPTAPGPIPEPQEFASHATQAAATERATASEKPKRRARVAPRYAVRETRRRLAYQWNWFQPGW